MSVWLLNLCLGVGLLLYADVIGPEAAREDASDLVIPAETANHRGGKSGTSRRAPKFLPFIPASIDGKKFRQSFQTQAYQAELLTCLRQWRASPAFVVIAATVHRDGRLTDITIPGTDPDLPACALKKLQAMRFGTVTQRMKVDTQDLQWRIDW